MGIVNIAHSVLNHFRYYYYPIICIKKMYISLNMVKVGQGMFSSQGKTKENRGQNWLCHSVAQVGKTSLPNPGSSGSM